MLTMLDIVRGAGAAGVLPAVKVRSQSYPCLVRAASPVIVKTWQCCTTVARVLQLCSSSCSSPGHLQGSIVHIRAFGTVDKFVLDGACEVQGLGRNCLIVCE